MKKLISLVIVLAMVLSLSVTALAVTGTNDGTRMNASATTNTVTINKTLTANGTNAAFPGDTLKFTADDGTVSGNSAVTAAPAFPAIPDVTVAEGATSAAIVLTLPAFSSVGIYTYNITETDTNVAGVTYRTDSIKVVLTVIEENGMKVVAAVHCEANPKPSYEEGSEKTDTFENVYNAGSLAVTKVVSGNGIDLDTVFNVTVTFTAPSGDTVNSTIKYTDDGTDKTVAAGWDTTATAKITLKNGETVTFDNIPYGVTYTVVETEANTNEMTTTYSNDAGEIKAATVTATITNTKNIQIDTGVILESLPYVVIGLVVMAAVVILIVRKTRKVED